MSARKLAKTAYRALLIAFFALVIAHVALDLGHPVWWDFAPLVLAYAVLIVANRWGGAPDSARAARAPVEVEPPVTGRWIALNSPADHTPSHHTHAYGQTFAIDVVAEPEPGSRPPFRALWPVARRNADFPAHGAPLHAVADATVVRATDTARDHLRRGSLTVREGDRVHPGQVLAQVGNSGNSTEPHLHFQLMDGPDPDTARGIPFTWRAIGVPRNNEVFEVPARPVGARA
ncbi:M23 family metallopeptidase [Streptomyces althioticus]|uniref:M23 family metallopeptidase n=1 Tax=Streptomyces althioticus TaxID=83380 RepID=UPI0033F1CBD7